MAKKPLRVGFDLDGVILYNPIRILRPFSAILSKLLFRKKTTSFYIPRSPLAKFAWFILHKSSFIPARGLKDLKKLVEDGRIEAHLITGRYASLTDDFNSWMKSIDADHIFASQNHNIKNEQPHVFKQSLINKLDIDIFVEDNWDIVKELSRRKVGIPTLRSSEKTPKVFWITNLLDLHIPHEHKFYNLRGVIKRIRELTN